MRKNRQTLTSGSGWFNLDTSERIESHSSHDGRNRYSLATGSQWEHETLYRTAGGKWVLHHSSSYEGTRDSWEFINNAQAADWLVRSGNEAHPACAAEYAALEVR